MMQPKDLLEHLEKGDRSSEFLQEFDDDGGLDMVRSPWIAYQPQPQQMAATYATGIGTFRPGGILW